MDEIKELLENWETDGLLNPDALAKAHQAILLMLQKIEALELYINSQDIK